MKPEKRTNHPVSSRHFRQVICRAQGMALVMESLLGLTWRPGDKSGSFRQAFRPLGSPLMVVQHSRKPDGPNGRERINLLGYKAEIDPKTSTVHYGGADRNTFAYDFGLRPHPGAKGRILDPAKNPSLGFLGLEIDKVRQKYAERAFAVPSVPVLPHVFLGFSVGHLPGWEDTPMLRARVAERLRKPVGEINAMGIETLKPLFEQEWETCFVRPGEDDNDTRLVLINHGLCKRVGQALRIYEDFRELLGAQVHNPARDLLSPGHRGQRDAARITNPTKRVAAKLGINLQQALTGDNPGDDEVGITLEKAVQEALGNHLYLCSHDDVVHMVTNPDDETIIPSGANSLAEIPEKALLSLMREAAGRHAESCTDEDLLVAANRPNEMLFARWLANIQVVRFDAANAEETLVYGPERLGRDRVTADFVGVRPYWTGGARVQATSAG